VFNQNAKKKHPAGHPQPFSMEAPVSAHRLIALIVEDDVLIRADIVSEFDWQGWKVLDTGDGEQALTIA
jgi:hypothetical protein